MLGNYKLIVDTQCEVYELLKHWADGEFWDLANHAIIPDAVYMIGRGQFGQNVSLIKQLIDQKQIRVVLSNPAEGSDTIRWQCRNLDIEDYVSAGKIIILSGGDIAPEYANLCYESFMVKVLDYVTNRRAMDNTKDIFNKTPKPYKFLFLNGRSRPHRKYLLERFKLSGLLDQALWTNLDTTPARNHHLTLFDNDVDLLQRPLPVQHLPRQYEINEYQHRIQTIPTTSQNFIKYHLFNNTWGEIYIRPEPYVDTYFSLVSETVFDYPYSFRTEKIWKPICMGHPWIAVSNSGYYRDLRNLGFKTFGHLIDESFDTIENSQDRIERIEQVVEDLCRQDLVQFIMAAEEVCKYNQQHLIELRQQETQEFPQRLEQFLSKYFNE